MLTSEWVALAQRVAATVVVTDGSPMDALVYAVSGGVKPPFVLVCPRLFKKEAKQVVAAGALACAFLPLDSKDVELAVAVLCAQRAVARLDCTLRILLDPIDRTMRYREQCVSLTQREFALLECLSAHSSRAVSAHKLLATVWGHVPESARPELILAAYVLKLRRKLERIGLTGAIATIRGSGYALVRTPAPF